MKLLWCLMLLALYEGKTSGSFECIFIVCLNISAIYKLYINLYAYGHPVCMALRAIYT